MKILLMHRNDGEMGGAQIQMHRLHAGFKKRGVEARILCREMTRPGSVQMPAHPRFERLLRKVTSRMGMNELHLVSSQP